MTPSKTIRLIIAGSRTVSPTIADIDREVKRLVEDEWGMELDDYDHHGGPAPFVLEVICGKAHGADDAGEAWGRARGIPVHQEPITREDIERHGKYLGPRMRNRRMAERGTHLLAFWDGVSGGTSDMVTRMVARRKRAIVVPTRSVARARAARRRAGGR